MPIPVTFNGAAYSIPVYNDTGYAQGPDNLSNYLVALASGSLQQTGGSFPLTADANFGPSFGLVSLYYKSVSANIASAGVIRLANGDAIEWRNVANTGNDVLAVNGSDQLTYNGAVITTSGSFPVSVSQGGTGDISLTPYAILTGGTTSTNPVQSVASLGTSGQVLTSNGASALPTWTTPTTGSGTVDVGILNHLAWYPASTAEVAASNFLINNSTGALAVPGTLTVGGQTIAEVGTASAPGITFSGALNDGFYEPTSGHLAITLGGIQQADFIDANYLLMSIPINMSGTGGPYKVIGMANGTGPQDAAAFGQIHTVQIVTSTGTSGGGSTTSTSFVSTSVTASITPTSASNKIKISLYAQIYSDSTTIGAQTFYTLTRGSTNLGAGTSGFGSVVVYVSSATSDNIEGLNILYVDSPATTSSTTYTLQIRSNAGTTTSNVSKNSEPWTVVLEEIQ